MVETVLDTETAISRFPEIDGSLPKRGWVEFGRAWYLAKNVADPCRCGVVRLEQAGRLIAAVTRHRLCYWRGVILDACALYEQPSRRLEQGFFRQFDDEENPRIRILAPPAVCRLLAIPELHCPAIQLPLRTLCGSKRDARVSFHECAVRAQYSGRMEPRERRAETLGISKSTSHRYDRSAGLVTQSNWMPAFDAEGMLFTGDNLQALFAQARAMNAEAGKPGLFSVRSSTNLSAAFAKALRNPEPIRRYFIVRQLPSTYEQHDNCSSAARNKSNRSLHTSATKAAGPEVRSDTQVDQGGRTCRLRGTETSLKEIHTAKEVVPGKLWVPVRKRRKN